MVTYGTLKKLFEFIDNESIFLKPSNLIIYDSDEVEIVDIYMKDKTIYIYVDQSDLNSIIYIV